MTQILLPQRYPAVGKDIEMLLQQLEKVLLWFALFGPSRQLGSGAHGGSAVAKPLGLHGLSFSAVENRIETEIISDGIHVHEIIMRIGHHSSVAVKPYGFAVFDFVNLAGGNSEIFAGFRDGRDSVPD